MKLRSSESRRQIALLVETSLGSGREILRGIAQFARDYANWEIFHAARGLEDAVPEWLYDWGGDGVIARIQNEGMLQSLKKLDAPIVDVLGVPAHDFPLVQVDDEEIPNRLPDTSSIVILCTLGSMALRAKTGPNADRMP